MTALCALFACLSLSVSAYTDLDGAPPFRGQTASGAWTRQGIAACGPSFPFGTVFLAGGKAYICMDRGPAITDGHLDVWYPVEKRKDAVAWGRKQMTVVVVR